MKILKEIQEQFRCYQRILGEEDFQKQVNLMYDLAKKLGLCLPHAMGDPSQAKAFMMSQCIYSKLQSEMMLTACISAKWSCKFAAMATLLSFGSLAVTLITVFVR